MILLILPFFKSPLPQYGTFSQNCQKVSKCGVTGGVTSGSPGNHWFSLFFMFLEKCHSWPCLRLVFSKSVKTGTNKTPLMTPLRNTTNDSTVSLLWLYCDSTVSLLCLYCDSTETTPKTTDDSTETTPKTTDDSTVTPLWLHCGSFCTSLWLHCGSFCTSLWLHWHLCWLHCDSIDISVDSTVTPLWLHCDLIGLVYGLIGLVYGPLFLRDSVVGVCPDPYHGVLLVVDRVPVPPPPRVPLPRACRFPHCPHGYTQLSQRPTEAHQASLRYSGRPKTPTCLKLMVKNHPVKNVNFDQKAYLILITFCQNAENDVFDEKHCFWWLFETPLVFEWFLLF